eukprot:symbB.v1.2.011826.t1/scaffold804.1/size161093/3
MAAFPFQLYKDKGEWYLDESSGCYAFDVSDGTLELEAGGAKARFFCDPIGTTPLQLPPDQPVYPRAKERLEVKSSEIMKEIQSEDNNGALFVLPSQLNGAEYTSHEKHAIVHSLEEYMRDNTGGPRGQLAVHPGAGQFIIDNAAENVKKPQGINAIDQLLQVEVIKDFLELKNGYLAIKDPKSKEIEEEVLAEQGVGLWQVRSEIESNKDGIWLNGRLVAVSDQDLHWWLTSGAGKDKERKFDLHLCSKAYASCRRGRGKAPLEFHSDYFRVLNVSDVTDLKIGWFKEAPAKADMKAEVQALEGSPDRKQRGSRKRPLGESTSEPEDALPAEAAFPEGKDAVTGALKRLRSEVDKDKKMDKKGKDDKDPSGRERRKEEEKVKKKKKKKSKERSGEEKAKKGGNWFGVAREPVRSESDSMETKSDDTPRRARMKRKKRRKAKREDRGPFGVGRKVKFSDEGLDSSKTGKSDGSEPDFQAAPSDKSRQLQLLEYSQNFPGRLAARLLTKMQTLLAREEGALNQSGRNQTPATATSYFITVVTPLYRDRMNVRAAREMRTIAKALDLIATGRHPEAADVLAQRYKALELQMADQTWARAQHLELIPPEGASLVEKDESLMATKEQNLDVKMKGSVHDCQRFISILVPTNAATTPIEGAQDTLPYIGTLSALMLEEDEMLYLDSEDLQSAFNLFSVPDQWLGYFAYSKKVDGQAFGLPAGKMVRPALSVVPMGWHSAVGVVQEAVRHLVFERAGVSKATSVEKGEPIPDTKSLAVVYLDNFDEITILKQVAAEFEATEEMTENHRRFNEVCDAEGLPRNLGKQLVKAISGGMQGGEFDGLRGTLKVGSDKLRGFIKMSLGLLASSRWSEFSLRHWTGKAAFCCAFRRVLFAHLGEIFPTIEESTKGDVVPPAAVVDEVLCFVVSSIQAETELKCPLSEVISCTDASPTGGASAIATKFKKGEVKVPASSVLEERCAVCETAFEEVRGCEKYPCSRSCGARMCSVLCYYNHQDEKCSRCDMWTPMFGERFAGKNFPLTKACALVGVGDRLQTEINTLASLLDAADGPAQAGQLAEGWYREACATNASALVGTNVTALTNLLYDLGQALEAAGVASLLQPGVLNQSVLNQLQNLTVFTPNSSLVSVISNITQANDDLNFSGLFSLLDGLAESELDRFNVNADQLDSFLQQLQALNDLGLNTVAVEGLLGSAALSSFGLATSGATNTDMSGLLQTLLGGASSLTANLNLLAIAFQQIRDLRPILQTFDQIMWWTSHFLQSSSLTTLVFGEVPFTIRNIPLRQGSPLNGMREDDGGQQAFSTEAAYQLQQVMRTLQTQVVPAFLGAEAASLTGLLDPSGLGAGLQGLPLEPAFRDLQSFVSRITNTTRAEIETSVVPSILNGSLETGACGPGAAEAVGQLIARTHERCPFYRAVIPQLARGSLTSAVQTSLENMKSFANTTLPLTLNESILEVLVRTQADFGYKPRVYEKTDWQKNCPDGSVIQTPAECKIAAVQMGKQWEGTTYLEGGHEYCVWSYNDKVSFNLAVQNFSKVDAMHPYAAFGSVCKTEKWQNYTKIYELVGAGFCRPPGCHPEAPSCRVNGYYGNGASLLDCRRRCEVDANCIGFSFLPSDDFGQVSGCFVHTNDTYVPPEWISYRKRYFSIGGASGTSTALCYRVVQKDPTLPATGGCYYKQPTVGNGRCSGPHLTWNPDYWGRENVWSWEDEARCLVRKINHDAYCETNTTWLFVLDTSNQTFVPQVTPRTVAERLTWLSTKELLKSLELPRCNDVPFEPRLANSGNSDGRRRRGRGGRRLQEQADYIRDYLGRRKVLVAPYKGEVKELIDMLTVEALLSAVEDSTSGRKTNIVEGLPGLFLQCPLVRGMSASSALQLFEDDLLFMESAEAVQDFARRQPDDVLLAVVFNSADAEGNFPATLDVDFSIRAHAQLLPPTSRIIRQSRDGGFFGFRNFYFYPYYELGFAQMEEAVGIATARLQARREARQRRSSRSVVGQTPRDS